MESYTVYRVELETLCARRVGDFSLPKTIGYYMSEHMAMDAIADDIADRGKRPIRDMEWTDTEDYRITPVQIVTKR